MLSDIGASQEQFLLVARKGLESPEDKKYFEQLIACDNYIYFKNMMIKRNLQLEEQAFLLMKEKSGQSAATGPTGTTGTNTTGKEDFSVDPNWKNFQKVKELTEVECAIQMSLALEEEKRRLLSIEEEELRVIIFILFFI
jgi:hypothetical protein